MKVFISSLGLGLDLLGVILLFVWTAKGYRKIEPLFQNVGSSVPIIARTLESLITDLNSMIEEINTENERRSKNSRLAILLIIAGFFLQLVSNFMAQATN